MQQWLLSKTARGVRSTRREAWFCASKSCNRRADGVSLNRKPASRGKPLACSAVQARRNSHFPCRSSFRRGAQPQPPHAEQSSLVSPAFGSRALSHCWNSTQPAQSPARLRIAITCVSIAQAPLNKPAKPVKAMDRMPAMIKFMAVPLMRRGTSAISDSSRRPAIKTSARVNPRPAPRA